MLATTLPAKETIPSEIPDNMNPAVEEAQAVAVPEQPKSEEASKASQEGSGDGRAGEEGLQKGGETKGEAVSYLELKQYSNNKPPAYPMQARREQRQGQVDLLYRVTKDGRVADVQVAKSSGHSDLDQAAISAVSSYRFVPGQEGWASHPVIFSIKGVATTLPSRLRGASASTE